MRCEHAIADALRSTQRLVARYRDHIAGEARVARSGAIRATAPRALGSSGDQHRGDQNADVHAPLKPRRQNAQNPPAFLGTEGLLRGVGIASHGG